MVKVMTFLNEKGGTGKTSITFNLAWKEAESGKKVCMVDLDPQRANLTYLAGIKKDSDTKTIMNYLRDGEDIRNTVQYCSEKNKNLHIIPADLDVAKLDMSDARKMKKAIEELSQYYESIYIDVPPTPGPAQVLTLAVCTDVVVVMLPDVMSLEANLGVIGTIQAVKKNNNPELNVAGLLFNRYDNKTRLGKQVETAAENMAKKMNSTLFDIRIRNNVKIAEAVAKHEGVTSYDAQSNGAADINSLYYEVMAKVRG